MAKYDVVYACGCKKVVNLFGKNTERQRKLTWMTTQKCWDCHKAEESREAAEKTSEMNLVSLEGSEKQVAWANKIRIDMIKALPPIKPEHKKMMFGYINEITNAAKWINMRFTPLYEEIKTMHKAKMEAAARREKEPPDML
jgi:hypothetical protein